MATSTIKPKSGTTTQWQASGRVLEMNEWGVEVTENGHHILRIGDGEHLFHELPAVFDAENYEELMAQAVDATNAANTATENADTARDNADAAAAAALAAANTASIAAQANTNAVVEAVSGDIITVSDSSNLALVGLKLYGKTTQVTTNGYQLFDASKLDTKTAGGCTVTNNGDGSLAISGSGTLTETFALSCDYTHEESVALLQEGTLHLSVGTTTPQVMVYLVRNGGTTALDNSNTTAEITQEMLTDTTFFLRLSVYGASGSAIKTGTVKPMLYQDGDGTYEPYTGGKPSPSPDYPQELKSVGDGGSVEMRVCGKNLLPYPYTGKSGTINGTAIRVDEVTQAVTFSGTPTSNFTWILATITLPPGEYCANDGLNGVDATGLILVVYDVQNQNQIASRGTKFSIKESKLVRMYYFLQTSFSGSKVCYPMLEYGVTATVHEPYNGQSITTQTPNGLPSIPVASGGNYTDANGQQWVCDEVDFARGVYVQRVGKIDSYSGEEIPSVFLSTTGELSDGATVLYALPASIETPLSAEEIAAFKGLHTNKPNTTVYNDSGAHMEMEYIADTKTYIDNKFTALQNAILSAGANV